jgi:hypothetical protein
MKAERLSSSIWVKAPIYRRTRLANTPSVRFEAFTAVTMKNVVFWDIETQFVLHRRHITSALQRPAG